MKNGDPIIIDAEKRELTIEVSGKELKARHKAQKKPAPGYICGLLANYAAHVTSASLDVPGHPIKTEFQPQPDF